MAVIDAQIKDRDGRIMKVRMDGVVYEVGQVWTMITNGLDVDIQPDPNEPPRRVRAMVSPEGFSFLQADPSTIGAGGIESLPPCPLKMFVFGDSIQWGQGLRPHEKIYRLVANVISERNGGINIETMNFAHSGAIIWTNETDNNQRNLGADGEDLSGEVFTAASQKPPNIHNQVIRSPVGSAGNRSEQFDDVHFILLDGGINDVGLRSILRMTDRQGEIRDETRQKCTDRMRSLLDLVTNRYPNARIIVTGYYPIVTKGSMITSPAKLALAIEYMRRSADEEPFTPLGRQKLIDNCQVFVEASDEALGNVVNEFNMAEKSAYQNPRIFFAKPNFKENHALFAPRTKLFSIRFDGAAQDPLAPQRRDLCADADLPDLAFAPCKCASVGHPTPAGARRYLRAIRPFI